MNELGNKIAQKRKDLGMTQAEFAERMNVTRQTVSRWEAGTVMPDIEKLGSIADLLGVSCDYLLRDDVSEMPAVPASRVSRLLQSVTGKTVRLTFFDGEADADLALADCTVLAFEGNWMKVEAETKKGRLEQLIPVSSVRSLVLVKEED